MVEPYVYLSEKMSFHVDMGAIKVGNWIIIHVYEQSWENLSVISDQVYICHWDFSTVTKTAIEAFLVRWTV